jgi:endothelin-converting enzyme/putative endopeptidase
MRKRKALLIVSLLIAGAMPLLAQESAPVPATPAFLANFNRAGLDLSGRDLSVRPGDDFQAYANGSWFRRNPIPDDRTSYSLAWQMRDEIERQVRDVIEHPGDSAASRQLNDFYASWMDEPGIEARGPAALRPYLDRIAAVRGRAALLDLFAAPGYASPVAVVIIPDPANPTRYTAFASQAGLGMPNRDYYLREGEQYDRYRAAYRAYVVRLQTLAGIPDAEAKADVIVALERRIAEAHWAPERSRDIQQIYNPMDRARLAALAPQFAWPAFLDRLGLGRVDTVIAAETSALTAEGRMLEEVPLETWKAWLAFHFLDDHARYLPRAFDDAHFDFHSRTLNGVPRQLDRWRRGIQLIDGNLGEAVGRIYAERHFPAESRRAMEEMIGNLRAAFAERLQHLDWMDDATRREALAKLDAFEARVGGPVRFIDYAPIRVERGDLLGNVIRAGDFSWRIQVSRLPNPVDRALWELTPQTVDAYYSALTNQLTFPAGILQPPFFAPGYDPAVNYGNTGATIGHEMGHGFDDQGRRFDGTGRIRDWWTQASADRYVARTRALGAQYSGYEPLPGLHINGELTMGENIGDLGGLEIAYAAYRRHVARHGEPPVIDGLTGDQRFFLSYAQGWRSLMREGRLRELVLTDPHSPPEWRVNGVVRNMDAWYRAFDVRPGDRLYLPPEQRVHIW